MKARSRGELEDGFAVGGGEGGEVFFAGVGEGFEILARAGKFFGAVERGEDGAAGVEGPAVLNVAEEEWVVEQVLAGGGVAEEGEGFGDDLGRAEIDEELDEHLVHARIGGGVKWFEPMKTGLALRFVRRAEADEGEGEDSQGGDLLLGADGLCEPPKQPSFYEV